jgi:hypothetical protein
MSGLTAKAIVPCLAAAMALSSPVRASDGDHHVVVVAVDRQAYLSRDSKFRTDFLESQVRAALVWPAGIEITMSNGGVWVRVIHLKQNARFVEQVRRAFAGDPQFAVTTQPAEEFRITYSPSGLARFGGPVGAHPFSLPLNPSSIPRDLAALESFVRRLRPPLPGFTVEGQPDGAIVRSDDPTIGADVATAIRQRFGSLYQVTRLADGAWRVTIAAGMAGALGPGRTLQAGAVTEDFLRSELRDPVGLETRLGVGDVEASLIDPQLHGAFLANVEKAFSSDPDFVLTTEASEVLRIALVTPPPVSERPGLDFPSQALVDAESKAVDLANPPVDIVARGDGITVRAVDPAHSAERFAMIEQSLSANPNVVVIPQTDRSLSIAFKSIPVIAPVSADRLVRDVQARLSALNLRPSSLAAIGGESLEVTFATEADAAGFRQALAANSFGFAVRVVDDTSSGSARDTAPSPGDKRFARTQGGDLWLKPDAAISGDMIADAKVGANPMLDQPDVEFRLTDEGRERFAALSSANVGRRIAIVLNGAVLEAPVIQSPILGGEVMITGNLTAEEALAMAQSMLGYRDDLPLKVVH